MTVPTRRTTTTSRSEPGTGRVMTALNPATEEVVGSYEMHSDRDVDAALTLASEAVPGWRGRSFEERAQLMRAAAAILRRDSDSLGALITSEMGKPISEARAEVEKSAWVCEYFAEHAEAFLTPESIETDASHSYVRFDPLGVVLAVMPWNFPFWQVFRFIGPTLMAGNTGLLKHASNVPGCSLRIEAVLREAGFPEGVFTSLLMSSDAVEAVIRDPRVAAVSLTGSEAAGRSVAATAGDEIKPSVLELGGSDPFIILEDADLDAALDAAVSARTINTGQSCIAAKRFIVERPLYDRCVEGLEARLRACVAGDPTQEDCVIGPLARADLVNDLHQQVVASVEDGARLLLGGEPSPGTGFYYPATLLADCTAEVTAFREETFGPVLAVGPAENADDALAIANASSFGLGASLWTGAERADGLASRVEAGHVAVNGIVKSDPRLPFGGIKNSGYGRELSRFGILEFVNVKTVWIA
jgi:succinate-semialdehyde dehydrogenase/glutarate-semialdehyde dehydrogenase